MTEWSDAEISRRLALAIGYDDKHILTNRVGSILVKHGRHWCLFDYRITSIIWPVAERFDAFPWRRDTDWQCVIQESAGTAYTKVNADTAAKAVALAVIKAKEQT